MVHAIPEGVSGDQARGKASSRRDTLLISGRHPLLDNGIASRKPKSREVSSRYLSSLASTSSSSSSSSSRRFPSPLVSRVIDSTSTSSASACSVPKRSQSADRRRPATPRPTTPLPGVRTTNTNESKPKFTSIRSLSVSFQGEAFSLPISRSKAIQPENSTRKSTPERRRTTPLRGKAENVKPADQRWPGKARQINLLSTSLDCTPEKTLTESRVSTGGSEKSSIDFRNSDFLRLSLRSQDSSSLPSEFTASDSDSVSSDSTSGLHERSVVSRGRCPSGESVGLARFWQDKTIRSRILQGSDSRLSTSPGSRTFAPPRLVPPKKFLSDGPSPSSRPSPRRTSSPLKEVPRPPSPSRPAMFSVPSPSRGNLSPSRIRSSIPGNNNLNAAPSVLSFSVDHWRGKTGDNQVLSAHMLRLLYNRHLQWRFINARAESTTLNHRLYAERSLWSALISISNLYISVKRKTAELQLLRQRLKLTSILTGQITHLDEWSLVEREHSICLDASTEALTATIVRIPVIQAKVDIQRVREAFGSALVLVQTIGSCIGTLAYQVEEVDVLLTELSKMVAVEFSLLKQCKDFASTLHTMQVKDSHLRAQKLQLTTVREA